MFANKILNSIFVFLICISFGSSAFATEEEQFVLNFDDSNPFHGQGHRTFRFYSADINAQLGISPILSQTGATYPTIPLFLPENPGRVAMAEGTGIAHVPICGQFSTNYRANLPNPIRERLVEDNIANNSLRIYFSSQNLPWRDGEGCELYLRPHFSTETIGGDQLITYSKNRNVTAGIFYSDTGNAQFMDNPGVNEVKDIELPLIVRSNGAGPYINDTRLAVQNLRAAHGQSLWSYVSYQDQGVLKAIVTLHWLLDNEQANKLVTDVLNHRPADAYPSNNYRVPRNVILGMMTLVSNLPAFHNRGGHVIKFNSLVRDVQLNAALAAADCWPESVVDRQAEADRVIQLLSQCNGGIEDFQPDEIIEIVRTAYTDLAIADRTKALKIVLLGRGLMNPQRFKFPGNAMNIHFHVTHEHEDVRVQRAVLRQVMSLFGKYAVDNGISVEQALHNAADYRIENAMPSDSYSLFDALSVRCASEARTQFRTRNLALNTEKRNAINAAYNLGQFSLANDMLSIEAKINFVNLSVSQRLLQPSCRALTLNNPLVAILAAVQNEDLVDNLNSVTFGNELQSFAMAMLQQVYQGNNGVTLNQISAQRAVINQARLNATMILKAGNYVIPGQVDPLQVTYNGGLFQKYTSSDDYMKRFYRLLQVAPNTIVERGVVATQQDAKALFVNELINVTQNRCDTGVYDGLCALERKYLKTAETDDGNLKAYYKIASKWMDYVYSIIDMHGDDQMLGSVESGATTRHLLRQRMKQVFPIGSYEYVAYSYLGNGDYNQNQPSEVIQKLVLGGRLNGVHGRTIDIPALTVKRLVDMMYEALDENEMREFAKGHPVLRVRMDEVFLNGEGDHFFNCCMGKEMFKKTVPLVILHELGFVNFKENIDIPALLNGNRSQNKTLAQLLEEN